MRHALAVAWLVVVVASAVYLTFLGMAGFPIRSDLLALVPQEEHDPVLQRAKDAVSDFAAESKSVTAPAVKNQVNIAPTRFDVIETPARAASAATPLTSDSLRDSSSG